MRLIYVKQTLIEVPIYLWRQVVAIVTLPKGKLKKRDLPVAKNLKLTLEFLSLQIYLTAKNMVSEVGNLTIFYKAIKFGQSPERRHYFPAFPYVAYSKIGDQDIADLWSFWKTLPSIETPNVEHEIKFPFNIRRNIGIWKLLYMPKQFVDPIDDRATYLVEALSHCAECHTPRSAIGGLNRSKWMRGAVNPSGQGLIPSIHPSDLGWSEADIIEYLSSGFTPDFDVASGKMVAVIENTSKLSLSDRVLIADYLMRISID